MARRKAHCQQCARGNVCAAERRALAGLKAAQTRAANVRKAFLTRQAEAAVSDAQWDAARKVNALQDIREADLDRKAFHDAKRSSALGPISDDQINAYDRGTRGHAQHKPRDMSPRDYPRVSLNADLGNVYEKPRNMARVGFDPETGSERYTRVSANSRTPSLERRVSDNALTVARVLDSDARPVKVTVIKTDDGAIMTPFKRTDQPETVAPKLTRRQIKRMRDKQRKKFAGKFAGNAVLAQHGLEPSMLALDNMRTFHGVPGCKCDAHTLRVNLMLPRESTGPCKADCRAACKCDKKCKHTCARKCSRKACAKNDCHAECEQFCHVTPREQNEKADEIPEVDNFTCPSCTLEFSTAYVAPDSDTCKSCAGIDPAGMATRTRLAKSEDNSITRVRNDAGKWTDVITRRDRKTFAVMREFDETDETGNPIHRDVNGKPLPCKWVGLFWSLDDVMHVLSK